MSEGSIPRGGPIPDSAGSKGIMTKGERRRTAIKPVRDLLESLARASPEPMRRLLNRLANPFSSPRKLRRYYVVGPGPPTDFLRGRERSLLLVDLVKAHADPGARILEIGCNVGRNLNYLFEAGFRRLEGIEINEGAVDQLRSSYPDMAKEARIHNAAVEDVIRDFSDGEFDLVFTMTVLMHIHPDSEWIFPQIARITTDRLITIENEEGLSWNHFPRDYGKAFESLGMRELEAVRCTGIEGLGSDTMARVFGKERRPNEVRA